MQMLTRDIELRDAILDLLDNCIDGIVREKGGKLVGEKPYDGYKAEITANKNKFEISDDCGGIPRKIAEEVAFRLGRPSGAHPEKLQTVGVYGIGMKRAIFKLGRRAVVRSEHDGIAFKVGIEPNWLEEDNWKLPMEDVPATGKNGTTITVTELYEPIAREFTKGASQFLENLYGAIAENYSVILGKGFNVMVNEDPVKRVEFNILLSKTKKAKGGINPYVFKGKIKDVEFQVVVGFYRPPLTDEEVDSENESPRADLAQAGWSVICNDRLVLRSDKTAVTGWGTGNVPRFHNQFSSIAGVVTLTSTNPETLPLKTTKRGIETSSDLYYKLLDYMRAGVKQFTDYTNKWKGNLDQTKDQFADATPTPASEIPGKVNGYKTVSPKQLADPDATGEVYHPELPLPDKGDPDKKKIVFTRPVSEIRLVAETLLDDEDAPPSEVGEACFKSVLDSIPKPKKKKP